MLPTINQHAAEKNVNEVNEIQLLEKSNTASVVFTIGSTGKSLPAVPIVSLASAKVLTSSRASSGTGITGTALNADVGPSMRAKLEIVARIGVTYKLLNIKFSIPIVKGNKNQYMKKNTADSCPTI